MVVIVVGWRSSLLLLPTFLAGALAAVLAVYAWRQRPKRAAVPFTALMVGLGVWSVAYGFELGVTSQGLMVLLDRVAFVGSVTVPTAWFLLALEYAGYEEWGTPRVVGLLAVEPLLTLALVWTNEWHGLIWTRVGVDASGPVTVLELTFGPAYWVNFAYSYLLMTAGILLLASVVLQAGRVHRRQSLVVLLGTVVPFVANAAFHLVPRLNPWPNVDLTTVAFALTGLCYALALFRFRLLELVPVARDRLVTQLDDGVVVVGSDGVIHDLNPTAAAALPNGAIGDPVAQTAIADADGIREGHVTLEADGETHAFDVTVTPITDFRGNAAGRYAVLRDVTQLEILRSHEQRLSVMNRILRHNVRNELSVIQSRTELLADVVEDEARRHLDPIDRATERIVAMSEEARHIETTLANHDHEGRTVDSRQVADAVAERKRAANGAAVSVEGPDTAPVTAIGRDHLETALAALVENAVVHNPSDRPRVWITVEPAGETTRVAVADDGPGIPPAERQILDRDRETPLDHGTGLGLWLVTWIVEASDGTVTFEPNEPTGSVVTIELPRATTATSPGT